jgi:hypothetical protein
MLTEAIETAPDRFIMTLVGFLHRISLRGSEIKAAGAGPQAQVGRLRRRLSGSVTVPVREISTWASTMWRWSPQRFDRPAEKNSARVKQFTREFMPVR